MRRDDRARDVEFGLRGVLRGVVFAGVQDSVEESFPGALEARFLRRDRPACALEFGFLRFVSDGDERVEAVPEEVQEGGAALEDVQAFPDGRVRLLEGDGAVAVAAPVVAVALLLRVRGDGADEALSAFGADEDADEGTNGAAKGWLHELFSMPESSLNKTYFGGIKPADVCRRIAETDWTDALQKLDPATRAVVEDRIAKCQELTALEVLESDGLTEQGMPLFIEGCRNYGPGAYKKSRVDAATWFSPKRHANPIAECERKWNADEKQRHRRANVAEAKTAEWYTTNQGYETINTAFRTGRQSVDADRLQSYIAREPDRDDMWLQRGITGGMRDFVKMFRGNVTDAEFLANPQSFVGREVFDDAFMSSTPVRGSGFGGKVKLNIYAPRGVKMAYAEAFTKHHGEMEMLLQRGGRYVITKVDVDEVHRRTFVDIALVSQRNAK